METGEAPLWTDTLKRFIARRSVELLGLALIGLALALALALLTHSASDPSGNVASPGDPRNVLGFWGAQVSDGLLQMIGLGTAALILVLGGWGWRTVSHQGLPLFWLNLAALPVAMAVMAMTAGLVPAPQGYPYEAGLGGVIGQSLAELLSGLIGALVAVPPLALAGVMALVSLFCLSLAMGVSRAEWVYLAKFFGFLTRYSLFAAEWVARSVASLFRREPKSALDDVPAPKPKAKKKKAKADTSSASPAQKPKPKRVAREKKKTKESKRASAEKQPVLALDDRDGPDLPPLSILEEPDPSQPGNRLSDDALEQNARLLEGVLDDFGVKGEIIAVRPGPVVTLYELQPAAGIKSSRVIGLADDIARSMSAISARVAVIPGKNAIGIELPNTRRETVYLRELLSASEFDDKKSNLTLALGKDIGGAPVMADLARMPHLLIAGTTGSGKSVSINTMILSILYRLTPDQCRLIMVDPKMLELSVYDDIPHLLTPVVTDPKKAVVALKWAVREMEDRYRNMAKLGVRNIHGYNQRLREAAAKGETLTRTVQTGFDAEGKPEYETEELGLEPMPYIVVIVDEMADLMLVAGKEVEASIQRLAQMARAAGLHLIMATQRPSVDVITGTIKANFPTRISFQVTSKIDSRTILGEQGAEQLLGMGDMLYMAGGGRITRVHGPFVSDEEVEEVVDFLKKQGAPEYLESVTIDTDDGEGPAIPGMTESSGDKLFDEAVAIVARDRKASTSYIQRRLQIGYNRAARLIEQMEEEGMISGPNHVGKREVLLPEHDE